MRSSENGLRSLSAELIKMISSYLAEDEIDCACIALEHFFQCTTSVVYHINATTTSPKRKRSTGVDSSAAHRQAVQELLLDPQRAARLRRITLLRPICHGDAERRYLKTAWTKQDSHVDYVMETIHQNAPELRFFATVVDRPLKPLLQTLVKLEELKITSTVSFQNVSMPSVRRLTILHSITQAPAPLPSMVGLTHLDIRCFGIAHRAVPIFIDLDSLPSLHALRLTYESILPDIYVYPTLFSGYSSSLRNVTARGSSRFRNFTTFMRWLRQVSSETLHNLSLSGIKFGYDSHNVESSFDSTAWPSVPQLRSLELLGGIDPIHFQALPCSGLRKFFVATKCPLQTDDALVCLFETASFSIEAVSIINHIFARLSYSRKNYYVFSPDFANGLARCLKLRHFEFVGSYFLEWEDWRFLCARTFLHLDQVHVEGLHPKRFDRPDKLDALCAHNINHVSTPHLQELYNGKMFVSPPLASQWVHKDPEASTVMMGNAECRDDYET